MSYERACKICKATAEYADLCKDCWLGIKCFKGKTKLLGRAVAYIQGNAQLVTRRERRIERKRRSEIKKLVEAQRKDRAN